VTDAADNTDMTASSATLRPRLSLSSKLAYSVGSVAFGLKAVAIGMVMLFYNQVMGLGAGQVSIAIGIALIVDAFASPVIGQMSDAWRSPWGRRHPFMYAAAIPAAVSVWALLNPPHDWGPDALFAYMTACIIAARVAIAMFEIPNSSLLPELVPDYDQRTVLASYRYLFGIVVPVAVVILAYTMLLKPFVNAEGQQLPGQLNPAGYANLGALLAALIFAAIVISAAGTHREIRYMAEPERHASLADLLATIRTTLLNRNLVVVMLSGVISGIGTGLVGGLGDYFNTYFWELSANQISFVAGAAGLAPFAAVAVGPWLARRSGKKTAILLTFFLSVFFGILPMGLRLLGWLPANGHPLILPMLAIDSFFAVVFAVIGIIIATSMMADIVEHVQVETGRRSEGLIFAADTMLKQIVTGVGSMGTGFILQAVRFPQQAVPGQVPTRVLNHLALIYLPINALTSFAAIAAISFYAISRTDHLRNLAAVAARAKGTAP